MLYRIIDDSGVVKAEIDIKEEWLPNLITQLSTLTTPEEVAKYTPVQTTLLDQLQLLVEQSKENPQLSAANTEAMCTIAETLEDMSHE